jgi:hypothetical protein
VLQKVISSHKSTIRGERLVAAAQMKLPARWQKFEIRVYFTHWVNQFFVGFRLQTLSPVALALRIFNLNCGIEDNPPAIQPKCRTARVTPINFESPCSGPSTTIGFLRYIVDPKSARISGRTSKKALGISSEGLS